MPAFQYKYTQTSNYYSCDVNILTFTMKLSLLFLFLFLFLFQFPHFLSSQTPSILDGLKSYSQLDLPYSVFGSESAAFDCHGKGPYVGVSDGRILKWHHTNKHWIDFAVTSPHRYIFFMLSIIIQLDISAKLTPRIRTIIFTQIYIHVICIVFA